MASSRDVVTAWRIVKAVYAARAFDGEGARLAGGRCTSPGRLAVYTADSIALAALELLVHLRSGALLEGYVLIRCRFPQRLVRTIDSDSLPANWRGSPPPAAVRSIGDEWLAEGRSAVLSVPSAVVEHERNYIFNPLHRDFAVIEIGSRRPFAFDV